MKHHTLYFYNPKICTIAFVVAANKYIYSNVKSLEITQEMSDNNIICTSITRSTANATVFSQNISRWMSQMSYDKVPHEDCARDSQAMCPRLLQSYDAWAPPTMSTPTMSTPYHEHPLPWTPTTMGVVAKHTRSAYRQCSVAPLCDWLGMFNVSFAYQVSRPCV